MYLNRPSGRDALRLPVQVLAGRQPIQVARWPDRRRVFGGRTQAAWTTWRELLLAATSAGRPEFVLRHLFPSVAAAELRVRADSLRAALTGGHDGPGNPVAVPTDWLRLGADPSESAAVSYRLGMAGAHWAATNVLGLSATWHLSWLPRTDPRRRARAQADLFAAPPGWNPDEWLLEAKGGWDVPQRRRREGALQLDAARSHPRGWRHPHGQLLASVSTYPVLHLLVELGLPAAQVPAHPADLGDPSQWPLVAPLPLHNNVELFWAQAVLAAALNDNDAQPETLTADGASLPVRMLDLPGVDARVGLLERAYAAAEPGLLAVRRYADRRGYWSPLDQGLLELGAQDVGRDDAAADLFTQAPGPVVLLEPIDRGSGPGSVVDRAGRVLQLGPSWLQDDA